MQYKILKSIIASKKKDIAPPKNSESFFVKDTRVEPFINPNFSKDDFPNEKPSILLISAIGASGKTTAAQVISFDLQLPILDLAKHKAVGDNTLTGILTTAYPLEVVGQILKGLKHGEYAVIIDGIDEGRSKTTEQGFHAFLDDLIKLSSGSVAPAIVILGRSQVILNAWFYLAVNGADVGLVQLDPFNLEQAKEYIDSHVEVNCAQRSTYSQARDLILTKLSAAFSATTPKEKENQDPFLSFIGYPPVLDAVSTLLQEEQNYYHLQQNLEQETDSRLETKFLVDISEYLLNREHREKALPNFINSIADDVGSEFGQKLRQSLYIAEEQCARILSRSLDQTFSHRIIMDDSLNERYENAVGEWCNDHPFLEEARVRNVVFAAYAVTRCALSDVPEYQDLAHAYVVRHQPTYHFLYIFHELAHDAVIDVRCFNTLIQSVSEFVRINAKISANIAGTTWDESKSDELQEFDSDVDLVITIEFPDKNKERIFEFRGKIKNSESIPIGPYLVNVSVTVPCAVHLTGNSAIESMDSCSISARRVRIDAPALTLSPISPKNTDTGADLLIDSHIVEGHVNEVSGRAGLIEIRCDNHELAYPLAKYVKKAEAPTKDGLLIEKYRRLRRIFSEFASHGKGSLAKYRPKIEHERVLRGDIGKNLLAALVSEQVLSKEARFYHVNMDKFTEKLGISWQQLRGYQTSEKLENFLRNI